MLSTSLGKVLHQSLSKLPSTISFSRILRDCLVWKERQWGGNVTELYKITSVIENRIGNVHSLCRIPQEQQIVN